MPTSASNPWGDFDRIVILRSRLQPTGDDIMPAICSLYFKVSKHTGGLGPITEEQFKEACVEAAIQNTVATVVEL